MPGPKRHHFVPDFYLRGFANAKGRIRVYRVGGQRDPITTSVKNAAVEGGFYRIVGAEPASSLALEEQLSQIEATARTIMTASLLRGFLPSPEGRAAFSVFLGLQFMRTPDQRRNYELMLDSLEKTFYENMSEDWARERLPLVGLEPTKENIGLVMDIAANPVNYRFVPHPDEFLRVMVSVALPLAETIAARSWRIGASPGPAFITSDSAVVPYSRPTTPPRLSGVGLGDAEQVYFPLDRHHVLTTLPPGFPEGRDTLRREEVLAINRLITAYSYRFVFQHPDDPRIDGLIPNNPRPLFRMNEQDVFDQVETAGTKRLSPIFSPRFARIPDDDELPPPGTRFRQGEIMHLTPPAARPTNLT